VHCQSWKAQTIIGKPKKSFEVLGDFRSVKIIYIFLIFKKIIFNINTLKIILKNQKILI
jgi:hypothetical protein